ncbi:polyadenylate-binding protein RBP45-like isoform X1 [Solanum stenotomum]|uniref:polyadenylate-binding protein RBP45-like isoform X1 n=1 Tax=Solanum stenotomum TaxID=172797 RepID=UPI0020D01DC5|nr:polyadenylate-binding protein RBP45-like isoform X1 [Solanum stenotomum]
MQPAASSMVPPPMAAQPQYQQQWMAQQPQYQVLPPQSGYYYQQPPPQQGGGVPPPQQQQQQSQYTASAQPTSADEVRTLWIGDLQFWMDEQYLYNCFAQTGEVVSAKVIRNKQTQQSEGYGFIEFNSHAAAERNLQAYNGTLMPNIEQNFRLNWASLGSGEKRSDNTPEYTIFVGDLAADVTDYMLQETFRPNYPSIKGAKVVTDRATGHTKGYGFVRFGDESEQLHAMTEMNGKFCSTRPMRIGPAANKKNAGGQMQASYQSTGTQNEDDPTNTTIFVGNLDASVTDDHLRQVFGNYGQLLHVKIPLGKRCGFVQFTDRSCAEEALRALSGTQLGGQTIRLSWGRSPSNKQQSQGDPTQWSGGYYGYTPGYDAYGYAQPTQDPNMYYAGYAGYGNYAQPPHQQQQMSQQPQ